MSEDNESDYSGVQRELYYSLLNLLPAQLDRPYYVDDVLEENEYAPEMVLKRLAKHSRSKVPRSLLLDRPLESLADLIASRRDLMIEEKALIDAALAGNVPRDPFNRYFFPPLPPERIIEVFRALLREDTDERLREATDERWRVLVYSLVEYLSKYSTTGYRLLHPRGRERHELSGPAAAVFRGEPFLWEAPIRPNSIPALRGGSEWPDF